MRKRSEYGVKWEFIRDARWVWVFVGTLIFTLIATRGLSPAQWDQILR
jgi:hypothetical protein